MKFICRNWKIRNEWIFINNGRPMAYKDKGYNQALTGFGCDISNDVCSKDDPIFTNCEYQGCDICTDSIKNALIKD